MIITTEVSLISLKIQSRRRDDNLEIHLRRLGLLKLVKKKARTLKVRVLSGGYR